MCAVLNRRPTRLLPIGSDMGYLFNALPFEPGSRMTGIWDAAVDTEGDDLCVCITKIVLGPGQDGVVESGFLGAHLPYHFGGFHGVGPDGSPWTVVAQVAPVSAAERVGAASPYWPMVDGLDRALQFNPETWIEASIEMDAARLRYMYDLQDVPTELVADWEVGELVRGLLAECCNVPLKEIAAGRITQCAFPERPHECQHDVFSDVFALWATMALNPEEEA
jgi:hypothetical protein